MLVELLKPLDRKLVRDLWAIKGQALAIAVVIGCGVGMYVMSRGMLLSLAETRAAYYERYRFADIIAPVKRAPTGLLDEIGALPGVRRAETRIRAGVILDVPGASAPITGEIQSLPEIPTPHINDIVLRRGRYLDPQHEEQVLALDAFAEAHGLQPGDHIHAILNGTRKRLTITGIVLSPEYIYAISPGEIVPDKKRFGVLWMSRDALAHAFDLDGAFNEAVLLTSAGSNEDALLEQLDTMLKRYGATGAYGRDQMISDQFLVNEINQLETIGRILPPIFLLVATFLLNVVVGRLIDTEREQIGLLKAFGYTDRAVALHYLRMIGVIVILGIFIGVALGTWLGRGLANMYQDFFKFPFLIFRAPAQVYLVAVGVSLLVAVTGTFSSVRRVMRLEPAVAMVPPPPPDYSRSARWLERLSGWIDQPTRMILRHVYRWPRRAAMAVLGIAMSKGLLIGASFSMDAMMYMVDISFNVIDRQDVTVNFFDPRNDRAIQDVLHAPGVMHAEPFRAIPVVLRNGPRTRRESIVGILPGAELSRIVDTGLNPIPVAPQGIVLSDKLAELLKVTPGELLRVEVRTGRRPELDIPVSQVVKTYMGTGAYMDLDYLNRLLKEDTAINGTYLLVDPEQTDALYAELKNTPLVAGVSLQEQAQNAFYETLQDSLGTFVFFNTLFAGLIAVGVVYNNARISLSERARELASLRVLGLTRGEISYILLGELALLTLLALPLGALLGYLLAATLVLSFDTELFRIPLVIAPSTYGYAALVVLLAALGSGLLVRRRIDRLDLIAVLKTRE
ncbi:ABC transporter permease [Microbulbifer yueqingensis]|uniref:Putative ABC transport system permease protein n=1 Tax=Microbulbifer yueqingensis TaxID=658219 RepID=A0A1G8ZD10_9GAMM|nr:FtsX-like permease family protein [Microbulbifer yueqingensis]SDK12898.1 putative ABC transport system permease protein [Microbulbifer yueqingensis]